MSSVRDELRHAVPGDAPLLAKIHQVSFPKHWNIKEFEDLLAIAGTTAWLYGESGLIICRTLFEQSEIITLAVSPQARRKGIASLLLDAAKAEAARLGAKRMFLEVGADNEAAARLYEKAGFALLQRRKGYYEKPGQKPMDALVMACDLA